MKTIPRRVPAVILAFTLVAAGGTTALGEAGDGFSPGVPALPGQVVRALPGQIVRALPGQIRPMLPGQMGRRVLPRPLNFAKPGPLWARTAVVMK